jgi:hypothetical protein
VVNKKDWINEAKLPPGVKSLITAHERVKTIEAEKAKPKPKPKGSVSDRLAALKARVSSVSIFFVASIDSFFLL